jgi:hypothetical protein
MNTLLQLFVLDFGLADPLGPCIKDKIPAKSIKLILENWLQLSPWPDRNIWKIRWEREECSFEQVEEVERFRVPDSISFRTWSLGIRG